MGGLSLGLVWEPQDARVAWGGIPGYVAAVRIAGRTEVHAGGRMAVESDSPPMRDDTLFRIASVTKPIGGALTLALVADGLTPRDAPIARRLPPLARPRRPLRPAAALDPTHDPAGPLPVPPPLRAPA